MTLTELRSRLEDFERRGYGERNVEVIPTRPPGDAWPEAQNDENNRYRPNFVIMHYVVSDVVLCPMPDDGPVNLAFTEGCEMPTDIDFTNDFAHW